MKINTATNRGGTTGGGSNFIFTYVEKLFPDFY